MAALRRVQDDVPVDVRERLLAAASSEGAQNEHAAVADLWDACLQVLGLEHFLLHPEDLTDLSAERAERMFEGLCREGVPDDQPVTQRAMQQDAAARLGTLLDRVGRELTLRGLLRELTGQDLLDELRPYLLRYLSAWLDQGVASWRPTEVHRGLYRAWRESAVHDPVWLFEGLEDWHDHLQSLPEDAMETVVAELRRLGLARERWTAYLQRLALELPGWSGMTLWRQLHPGYDGRPEAVDSVDYLAVRLVLERIFAQRLTARLWGV